MDPRDPIDRAFPGRHGYRDLAQRVPCPDPGCEAPPGAPCLRRDGVPMEHMDHPRRLAIAVDALHAGDLPDPPAADTTDPRQDSGR
ncbi:zinc finger domain-containing protein [Crossiella sp. CA198]|uniref:zinc finger domain-containing protein n=1 Tax=Crossiella sp. CA198 TaxID=3455607 RepID=UPI003F8D1F32